MKTIIILLTVSVMGLASYKYVDRDKLDTNTISAQQERQLEILKKYSIEYRKSDNDGKEIIKEMVNHYYSDVEILDIRDARVREFLFVVRGY